MKKGNCHVGSDFDSFLASEGLLEGACVALNRVMAWQIAEAIKVPDSSGAGPGAASTASTPSA